MSACIDIDKESLYKRLKENNSAYDELFQKRLSGEVPLLYFKRVERALLKKGQQIRHDLGIGDGVSAGSRCLQCNQFFVSKNSYKLEFKRCSEHRGHKMLNVSWHSLRDVVRD